VQQAERSLSSKAVLSRRESLVRQRRHMHSIIPEEVELKLLADSRGGSEIC
jgi:hypothetical protein